MKSREIQLLHKPQQSPGLYQEISAEKAQWNLLNFRAMRLKQGETWTDSTGENEYAIVLLGGNFSVKSDKGTWKTRNGRKDVFSGIAHTLYLPRHTEFQLRPESDEVDIAVGWCETDQDHPPYLKQPQECTIEIRGGDNANRQINSLIQPGFDCHRLVCVEVYTPSGNWSSYPPHKHDERVLDDNGQVQEAELEEIYFYKVDNEKGFALQQVYTSDRSLDEIVRAYNNDLVLVPRGYHPVVAGHGYNVYYLNFLAGSDQSLANSNDPEHEWIFGTWRGQDDRLPMVTADMNGPSS
jgi:5-deoxy-glucuronate isomerase